MKNFIFSSILLLATCFVNAQAPVLQAENSFGGREVDHAFSIQQTRDGGFITAGHTQSNNADVRGNHGNFDFWVVKLDKNGTIKWQKCLGGTIDETAFRVRQTTDGGYIVAGEANSNGGQVTGNHGVLDFWVVKLDSSGNLLWEKSLGGSKDDFATSIQQTKDGGYIVAGGTFSNDGDVTGHHGQTITADYWVVKLDANGNKQWEKSYGGSNGDIAMSVIQTKDGGYVVAGNSTSNNGDVSGVHDFIYGDFWIIKLNSQGNLQWQKALGGSDYEQANSIQQTKDGGFITCGWSRSNDGDVSGNHGDYDFWVVKFDAAGNVTWKKSLGGSRGDLAYSIEQTTDNGYIIAGGTNSNDGDVSGLHGRLGKEDFWVVKLDVNGILQWQKTLGGTEFEEGRSVDQTKDGGYIVAGWSGWDNPNNGDVTGNHGNYDFWIVKLSANPQATAIQNTLPPAQHFSFTLSPNPASSFIQIDITTKQQSALLRITNCNGNTVIEKNLLIIEGVYHQQLDISKLLPGLYYISVTCGEDIISKSFVKK